LAACPRARWSVLASLWVVRTLWEREPRSGDGQRPRRVAPMQLPWHGDERSVSFYLGKS
jgi:hypothetical protein